jgi:transporter family protein
VGNKFLILVPIVFYGFWSFFLKLASSKLHPFQISMVSSCVAIAIMPLYIWVLSTRVHQPFSPIGVLWTIAASVSSLTAALVYMYIMQTGEIGILSALISTSPAITLLLATIFLGEQITWQKIVGILLVVLGVMVLGH